MHRGDRECGSVWLHEYESGHYGTRRRGRFITLDSIGTAHQQGQKQVEPKISPPRDQNPSKSEDECGSSVAMVANKRQGAARAVLVWHVCNVCWYIVCQSPAGQQPQPLPPDFQTVRTSVIADSHMPRHAMCVCLCVSVWGRQRERERERGDGWIFGSGSFQRTWEQPCFLNIHVWYPQVFGVFLHETSKGA